KLPIPPLLFLIMDVGRSAGRRKTQLLEDGSFFLGGIEDGAIQIKQTDLGARGNRVKEKRIASLNICTSLALRIFANDRGFLQRHASPLDRLVEFKDSLAENRPHYLVLHDGESLDFAFSFSPIEKNPQGIILREQIRGELVVMRGARVSRK